MLLLLMLTIVAVQDLDGNENRKALTENINLQEMYNFFTGDVVAQIFLTRIVGQVGKHIAYHHHSVLF